VTDQNAIIERLGAVFVESFPHRGTIPDTDLLETVFSTRSSSWSCLVQLEQRFDLHIKIDDIELDDLRTLARIARLVTANGGAAIRRPRGCLRTAAD